MGFGRRTKHFLIRTAARWLIGAVVKTCRIRIRGEDALAAAAGRPTIHTFWHRHIFFTIHRFRRSGAHPLISHSSDGEIVSQVARAFGMDPVRGSSSRGGTRAFLELLRLIRDGGAPVLITADGPKGPPHEVKPGTVLLAGLSGAVVIPIAWSASRVKVLEKTWDRFMVPLPFSEITFAYGDPLRWRFLPRVRHGRPLSPRRPRP